MKQAIERSLKSLGVILTFVALLGAPVVRAQEVVKVGDLPTLSNAGVYVALEKGYFMERGIKVEMEVFASAGKMTPALATGQLDVATGATAAALYNAIASGQDFKIVADKGQIRPGYGGTMLIVRKDLVDSGQVKSVKDLKGRTVAIGAKAIALEYFLAKAMEEAGLSYESLNVTYLAYPDGVRAMASKAIDAMWGPEPWGATAEAQRVGVRFLPGDQVKAITPFQTGVIMYSGKFMRERPKLAREFLAAYVKGARYHNEKGAKDPEIMAMISKHTKVPVETIKASVPLWLDPDGKPRVQDLLVLQDFFFAREWVKTKLPAERIVDLSFLQ